VARQHALHVAVENRAARAEGEGRDRRSGRAADTGQRRDRRRFARKGAGMIGDDRLRGPMQHVRAAVVAQSAPLFEHALDRRRGKARHVGKRRDEPFEIRDDGRDLRLLQHDLGQPDPIRIARVLPGKVAASGAPLPCDQPGREARHDV
jgi:hypothetical protein